MECRVGWNKGVSCVLATLVQDTVTTLLNRTDLLANPTRPSSLSPSLSHNTNSNQIWNKEVARRYMMSMLPEPPEPPITGQTYRVQMFSLHTL